MAQDIQKPEFDDEWIPTQEYEGDKLAAQLEWNLAKGVDFSIPDVDWEDDMFKIPPELIEALHRPPKSVTTEDVTKREYGGTGSFDAFMESFHKHLKIEFDAGRITGAEYATTWTQLAGLAMQHAVSFTLQKDKVSLDLINTQIQAITGLIGLASARVQLAIAQGQVHINRANYCLTKLKLATEDASYAYGIENMEAARAQTADTRLTDGKVVLGSVGKQKELISEQIVSFRRNAEVKVAELYTNMWVAMKTVDEGLLPPAQFQNGSIDAVITGVRTKVGL